MFDELSTAAPDPAFVRYEMRIGFVPIASMILINSTTAALKTDVQTESRSKLRYLGGGGLT